MSCLDHISRIKTFFLHDLSIDDAQALTKAVVELHLAKYIKNPKLKELLVKNEKLRETIAKSIYKIENYLNEMKIEHNVEVELWKDVEVEWTRDYIKCQNQI